MISLIAAVAKNRVIGKHNALPWYLPEDLKRFRMLTTGKTILMGRKTYESILKQVGKPLPNRVSVVVTRQKNFDVPAGVKVYTDLNLAINAHSGEELMVIGGGQIYKQTMPLANRLYITHVDQNIDGDVYFPEIDFNLWNKIDDQPYSGFNFCTYERI